MGREGVDEKDLLAGLGVDADDRMLGVGELGMEREALLDRHRRAEAGLDAVARAQRRDPGLDVLGQPLRRRATMLAHIVSPPTGGHSTQRRTQPKGGFSRQVASVCQEFS